MKTNIAIIADTDEVARAMDLYVRSFLKDKGVESYFTTYEVGLPPGLFRQTDLFILELLRHDSIGYRAEAIPVAEKLALAGKKTLIVSGAVEADKAASISYWDLSLVVSEPLHERIKLLLKNPPATVNDFNCLKTIFQYYCRPPVNHHRR